MEEKLWGQGLFTIKKTTLFSVKSWKKWFSQCKECGHKHSGGEHFFLLEIIQFKKSKLTVIQYLCEKSTPKKI